MFRIKKLDIFIAKQFGLLFVGTFFICQFVLMMQFLWRYVDELIGKGLSLEVMAQFFWYMGLMLMPQAFPLAILLSSLITFGNLGESSELTAIKAAGVSLTQAMRSLIVIVLMITGMSLFFQDVIGPLANQKFFTLLRAMKQASPELEIPEGIFYDGIPGSNIYVQKKDLETGKLYGIMIYRQSGSYEDQAIILADSGMMQSTAEKMHLLLTLWNGEWFENMNSQEIGGTAEVPYRRETFAHKQILIDFDSGLDMDMTGISSSAQAKGIRQLVNDLDSINEQIDSMGHAYQRDAQRSLFYQPRLTQKDSVKLAKSLPTDTTNIDSVFARLSAEQRQSVVTTAAQQSKSCVYETDMKADWDRGVFKDNFRNVWPALNGHLVYLEITEEGENVNRYMVPIRLNGERCNLVVDYDFGKSAYEIIGVRPSSEQKGVLVERSLLQLKRGDRVQTLLQKMTIEGDDREFEEVPVDDFVLDGKAKIEDEDMGDGNFVFLFEMTNLKNESATSQIVCFDVKDGKITTKVLD